MTLREMYAERKRLAKAEANIGKNYESLFAEERERFANEVALHEQEMERLRGVGEYLMTAKGRAHDELEAFDKRCFGELVVVGRTFTIYEPERRDWWNILAWLRLVLDESHAWTLGISRPCRSKHKFGEITDEADGGFAVAMQRALEIVRECGIEVLDAD